MMHEPEKSDRCVVPRKSSNNAVRTAAEGMEGRRLVKGRPRSATHAPGAEPDRRVTCAGAVLLRNCMGRPNPNGAMVSPKTGARCGKAARRDLRGGLVARPVPTATVAPLLAMTICPRGWVGEGIQ
jgi:hypothetical protein